MWWIAAFLSLILWVLGWESGFLGPSVHVFLLLALLAVLAGLLPAPARDEPCNNPAGDATEPGATPPTSEIVEDR